MNLPISVHENENCSSLVDSVGFETSTEETVLNRAANINESRSEEHGNLIGATDLVASTIVIREDDNRLMSTTLGDGLMAGFDEEQRKLEEEPINLYYQLNEKDKEINQQSQYIEKLKKQLKEREELFISYTTNQETKSDKEEVEEVFQVLVKFAVNYNQKLQEIEIKNKENEALKEEVFAKQTALDSVASELQQLRNVSTHQHEQTAEMLTNLLKDLREIGGGEKLKKSQKIPDINDKTTDEFTIARLFFNDIQSAVKNLVQRCQELETFKVDCNKKICEYKRKLSDWQLLDSQHEARILTLTESMEEAEARKRALEDEVDSLRKECATLKAAEQAQVVKNKENAEKEEAATKLRITLKEQMNQLRIKHQKLIVSLKGEISEKQEMINELKDQNQKLIMAHNQIQADYNQLKQAEAEKSVTLQEMILANKRREQVRKDFKGWKETFDKELQKLDNICKHFVQDLHLRIKENINAKDNKDNGGSLVQKQKNSLLEKNLDQLTKDHQRLVSDNKYLQCKQLKLEERLRATMERVKTSETALRDAEEIVIQDRKWYKQEVHILNKDHQRLVSDNSDLRCKLSELEKKLRTTIERLRTSETALCDAKEIVIQDRKWYKQEVNRLNEVIRQMNLARRRPSAQTAKPICTHQQYVSSGNTIRTGNRENDRHNSFVDEKKRSQNIELMYNSYTHTVWHAKYQY